MRWHQPTHPGEQSRHPEPAETSATISRNEDRDNVSLTPLSHRIVPKPFIRERRAQETTLTLYRDVPHCRSDRIVSLPLSLRTVPQPLIRERQAQETIQISLRRQSIERAYLS